MQNTKLKLVISGGQTGVDQAALKAAHASEIATGGWAPDKYLTEDGLMPILLSGYGLIDSGMSYPKRTILNIKESDGTLIIHDRFSDGLGTKLTIKMCEQLNKPHNEVWLIDDRDWDHAAHRIVLWLIEHNIEVLNVAGGRESRHPGIFDATYYFLLKIFGRR